MHNLPHHHTPDQDQRTPRRPRWDRRKNWRKEYTYEEAGAGSDGSEACSSAFSDARPGLDECCYGRAAEERADGDGERVDAISKRAPWEISRFRIDDPGEAGHGVKGCSCVDDVNVEEGEESESEVGSGTLACDIPVCGGEVSRKFLE